MVSKRAVLVLAGVFCVAGCAALILGNTAGVRLEAGSTLAIIASSTATTTGGTTATTSLQSDWSVSTLRGIKTEIGTCGSGMIRLSWNEPSSTTGTGSYTYVLLRDQVDIYAGTDRRFVDTGLKPSTSYTYILAASQNGTPLTPVTVTVEAPDACPTSETGADTATTTTVTTAAVSTTTTTVETPRLVDEIRYATATPRTDTASSAPRTVVTLPPSAPVPVSVVRDLPVATSTPVPAPPAPEVAAKAETLTSTLSSLVAVQESADTAKSELTKLINDTIDRAASAPGANTAELEALRASLIGKIRDTLDSPLGVATGDAARIASDVGKALAALPGAHPSVAGAATSIAADAAASPEVALLYKDSNKDGISDYDAIHVFGMSPTAVAPTTVVGKKIYTPEAKVLAGYDPTKKELVRVFPEEPSRSSLPPTKAYTVDSVALTNEATALSFSGKALPNSFITIYIFSTPVVVTVKTDSNGTWNYTLDRELENGLHTVETATVDNTGRILAKSQPFPFTKTAQAASLEAMPLPAAAARPTLLSGMNFYIVFGLSTLVFFLALVYVGIDARRRQMLATTETGEAPYEPPPQQ